MTEKMMMNLQFSAERFITDYSNAVISFQEKLQQVGYVGPAHKLIQEIDAEDQFSLGGIPLRDVVQDLYASGLYILVSFFFILAFTGVRGEKRTSWVLSLIVSMTEVFLCVPVVYDLFVSNQGQTSPFVYRDNNFSRFAVTIFIAFMIMDLVVGNIFYPKQIDFLSGYFHHTFYLVLLSYALKYQFSNCFLVFLPLELPTAILALGSVYSFLRSDALFGVSFFLTRICYHAYLLKSLVKDVYNDDINEVNLAAPCALTFLLHIYWFTNWSKKYSMKSRNKKSHPGHKSRRNFLRSECTWIKKCVDEQQGKDMELKKKLDDYTKELLKLENFQTEQITELSKKKIKDKDSGLELAEAEAA